MDSMKALLLCMHAKLVKQGYYREASNILYLIRERHVLKLDYKSIFKYINGLVDYNTVLR